MPFERVRDRDHLIVLPGGSYREHAPHEAEPVREWLRARGLSASVFRYPVRTAHPAALNAIRERIRVQREAGSRRIGLLGFSAGAHAAGLAALSPTSDARARPDLLVLCYPVVSMGPLAHPVSREMLLGPEPAPDLIASTSLEALVDESSPPVFVWHCADDQLAPVAAVRELADSLAAHGVAHELHVYPSGGHGLGLAEGAGPSSDWTHELRRWLDDNEWGWT